MNKLEREFYRKSSIQLEQELIGKVLVRNINGQKISGRIVEVEAYMGIDKSSNGVDLCKDHFLWKLMNIRLKL